MAAFCYVFFISLLSTCMAAKFVVFPMFSRSHYLVLAKLGEELISRGHDVQTFVGETETFAFKSPAVRQFKTGAAFTTMLPKIRSGLDVTGGNVIHEWGLLSSLQEIYCDAILGNEDIRREVESADLVIGDSMFVCSSLIAENFTLPHVIVFTNTISSPTAHAFGLPLSPAYVPQFKSTLTDNMNFMERVKNLYHWLLSYLAFHYKMAPHFEELKERYHIAPKKTFLEILRSVDLVIGQFGLYLDFPRPLLPNTRVVGPFLTAPAKRLPDDLERFAQSSGESGLIVVAFGTTLGNFDEQTVKMMADAFAKLPNKIIWKLSKEEATIPFSANIKVVSWMPQNDLLGHPQTRLFIGHCGLNGIFEVIYHGLPMICSPFFGDQFDNAVISKRAGFSETIELKKATTDELVSVILKVLKKPSHSQSAIRISKAMKLWPRTPVQEAADWVEYAQAQGGLQYLRPRGLDLPFYQLYLLDILTVAFLIAIAVCLVMKCVFRSLKKMFVPERKIKTQ